MTTILTHCALRLGDNLAALHFMRALAKAYPDIHFRHAAQQCYLSQLIDVVADLPNLQLADAAHHKGHSWNLWKNAEGFWESHAIKNDYAGFMLLHADMMAKRMGLKSPLHKAADLLFDYPALHAKHLPVKVEDLDFLIVNSPPQSGQWRYDAEGLNTLIQSLAQRYRVITTHRTELSVICTQDIPLFSVTNIGQLSQICKYIIMVSTGPSWPTFNVWNADSVKFRLILIDHEWIGLTKNTEQCENMAQARRVLKVRGLL